MRDFSVLSDVEFEELVGDLFAADMTTTVEKFAPGADGGIDLRWKRNGRTCIAQCKHYRKSSFGQLYASAQKEVPKVRKVAPSEYRFVTSFDLTVAQKERIYALFSQWMTGPEDIYGLRDINSLIAQHPDVERQHPKLWVTTGMQLFWHLHSDIANRAESLRERIEKAMPRYVVHPAYEDARMLLKQHSVCLISGPPGIGKTTLAQMLLAEHITSGFEPIEVSRDINEAWTALDREAKQIFFYDDFLGQISFSERLSKNEDRRLSDLIEKFSESANKKLILTTREYILRDAKRSYERLGELDSQYQFVLELESYRKSDRAHILYNHLWHSEVAPSCLAEIADAGYKKIINHPAYSPRVVEYCTGKGFDTESQGYPSRFKEALDNPERMWRIAFERHLTVEQQLLVMIICTLPMMVEMGILHEAHASLCDRLRVHSTEGSFRESLELLEGTFVSINRREDDGLNTVRHCNPSVTEFAFNRIAGDQRVLKSILASAVFFEQLQHLFEQGHGGFATRANKNLMDALARNQKEFIEGMSRTFDSMPTGPGLPWFSKEQKRLVRGPQGAVEDRVNLYFQVDEKWGIGVETLKPPIERLICLWRSGDGSKDDAARVYAKIISHESIDVTEEIHEAYHVWLESTLRDDQDWSHFTRHLWEDDGVILTSDAELAARYEDFADNLLQSYSANELDLDGLQSMALDFGLSHLSGRIDAAMQELHEPDEDYERINASADDSRESDEYISELFGRLNE
jgi:DNA polymerase III delta prime subunit